ncbi:competence type IV pilus minor pilin ComGE [Enterococcus avium]|uniref:competence type IV pilus minor pilin ComGE n=1 Tax=Enterococcus avium TaxID=33945 RepID=UPI00288D9939|nr:competence type IV pilus minor pilin ComGE [Enterococcus avium]MDT2390209.1 competence type IV pilus minor pilin ComGE [Enterococcus avium]MDT2501483.1 competence type IV pilus minor pilin ComGE [Enterococcus avium]
MVVLKGSKGYILLESLVSLTILLIIVASYVGVTVQMQKESRQRLATLENYRDLYTETRRCRLHFLEMQSSQMEISMEKGIAIHQQGGIVIVKK